MSRIGETLVEVSLLVIMAAVIVVAIVNLSWWFAVFIPLWVGIVLVEWGDITG